MVPQPQQEPQLSNIKFHYSNFILQIKLHFSYIFINFQSYIQTFPYFEQILIWFPNPNNNNPNYPTLRTVRKLAVKKDHQVGPKKPCRSG